ncbi:DUF7508 domain-containing protein [Candidatus Nitrosotenuis cloacae]|uniref:DUF7508 domain-containing protein n=1 Tax=Candidatus Nitrosotenuis cloacae TaxID=1603555 RepID=UPI00227DBEAE|nr:hypothetical protein [Candidatus Nitrosotenuis cloacae]
MPEIPWSDWIDFNPETISGVPESPGVFMMHAAMKILHIGGSDNMQKSISELFAKACTCDAKRFRYSATANHDQVKSELLSEYQAKHGGQMPKCMQ